MKPVALLIALALGLFGCEDPHSDMGDQPKYKTYEPTDFFIDGASARIPPAGTIARDAASDNRVVAFDTQAPFPITPAVVRRGAESFDTYCAVCHGRLGNGEGMIVQRGFTRPPSFHVPRLKQAPDAHFYNVITQGYGAMFSYEERVTPTQRWEIIAYIRTLQTAGDSAPPDVQKALLARGDRPPPTTGPAGGGR
jgi:mono/diheme cytochrome c family protein